MRRDKDIRFLIVMSIILHWVYQIGVHGNSLKHSKSEGDYSKEKIVDVVNNETNQTYEMAVSDKLKSNESPSQSKALKAFKEALDKKFEEKEGIIERTDVLENQNFDKYSLEVPDEPSTVYGRFQEMPLKLGLQFLSAKYGISESLDKARKAGSYIYEGTKDAVKTMTDFIGDGIGNARYLLFGTK